MHERVFTPIDPGDVGAGKTGPRLDVRVLADTFGLLLAPLNSAGIVCDAPVDRGDEGELQLHDPVADFTYQIISAPQNAYQGALCVAPDVSERATLLAIPPDLDPGVGKLARKVSGTGSPAEQLSRLADELREHHGYSLSFTPQGEPISDFVLNHRAAHCEYFASAMVIMARSIGIPARFVSGYYAHEREGNQTIVRGRDAHAWAECWIDGTGWVTVDATPSAGTPDALYPRTSAWRRCWDSITDLPRLFKRLSARANRSTMILAAAIAVAIASLVSLIRYLRNRPKLLRPRALQYPPPPAELAAAARRFERAAQQRGHNLAPHRTWRESLATAPAAYHEFISTYNTLRFGAAGDPHRLNELLDQIEQEPRNPNP